MSTGKWEKENVRTVTNLAAVITGVLAVVALAIVAAVLLGKDNKDSVVAVTTSALGIISAVVSAFLGIKATANAAAKSTDLANEKADLANERAEAAQGEVRVKKHKVDRLNEKIDEREKANKIDPQVARELRDASIEAESEARQDPPEGGDG